MRAAAKVLPGVVAIRVGLAKQPRIAAGADEVAATVGVGLSAIEHAVVAGGGLAQPEQADEILAVDVFQAALSRRAGWAVRAAAVVARLRPVRYATSSHPDCFAGSTRTSVTCHGVGLGILGPFG